VVAWWVWLAFAVANLIDLAVQGRDRLSLAAAAALVLVTGVMYVAAFRPRVIAAVHGIEVRNPLRDHRAPWATVTNVDLRDLLRVHCAWQEPANGGQRAGRPEDPQRTRVIQAWALQSARRAGMSGMRASLGQGQMARRSVGGSALTAEPPGALHRKETERIARALAERARRERADAARPVPSAKENPAGENRAEENRAGQNRADDDGQKQRIGPGAGDGPEWAPRPVSAWHGPSVLAVLVPALLLAAAILALRAGRHGRPPDGYSPRS
jgi:hypothetical protein